MQHIQWEKNPSSNVLHINTNQKGLHIQIFGKEANTISYDTRDGSQPKNIALRVKEAKFLQQNFTDKKIIVLQQEHGSKIVSANQNIKQNDLIWDTADGVYSEDTNFLLTIVTADCLPIFFFVDQSPIIAAVHAGWQGTHKSISAKMVDILLNKFRVDPEKIYCYILPGISGRVYEVQEDVADFFPGFVAKNNNHLYLDIIKANFAQITNKGILQKNIFLPGHCTFMDNNIFFSHRKKNKGRNLNIIYRESFS